jgi:type II secretory pathway component PulF
VKAFEYVAADANGGRITGTAWAADETELDLNLERDGLLLTRARKVTDAKKGRSTAVGREELINLTNQLSTVTSAGVPIVEGLAGIGPRLESRAGRQLVEEMVTALRTGESLSSVVAAYPRTFSSVYRSTVLAGEASGALDLVLTRLAAHLDWVRKIRATTIQALIYPAILLCAVFGLICLLLTFVLPRIIGLFPGGVEDLPMQTRIVIGASDFLRGNALWLLPALGATFVGLLWTWRNPRGRAALDSIVLRIPKLGSIANQLATTKFASSASILQSAGCDVFTILDVSASTCGNAAMARAFGRVAEAVRRGGTLSDALAAEPLADSLLVQMIDVGERTGRLDECLEKLVSHYDEEIPRRVKRFLALLEPTILLGAGVVVAFILLATLLPIFDLYDSMG